MFFLAATLVGWIRGDFIYRKVAAKNVLSLALSSSWIQYLDFYRIEMLLLHRYEQDSFRDSVHVRIFFHFLVDVDDAQKWNYHITYRNGFQ